VKGLREGLIALTSAATSLREGGFRLAEALRRLLKLTLPAGASWLTYTSRLLPLLYTASASITGLASSLEVVNFFIAWRLKRSEPAARRLRVEEGLAERRGALREATPIVEAVEEEPPLEVAEPTRPEGGVGLGLQRLRHWISSFKPKLRGRARGGAVEERGGAKLGGAEKAEGVGGELRAESPTPVGVEEEFDVHEKLVQVAVKAARHLEPLRGALRELKGELRAGALGPLGLELLYTPLRFASSARGFVETAATAFSGLGPGAPQLKTPIEVPRAVELVESYLDLRRRLASRALAEAFRVVEAAEGLELKVVASVVASASSAQEALRRALEEEVALRLPLRVRERLERVRVEALRTYSMERAAEGLLKLTALRTRLSELRRLPTAEGLREASKLVERVASKWSLAILPSRVTEGSKLLTSRLTLLSLRVQPVLRAISEVSGGFELQPSMLGVVEEFAYSHRGLPLTSMLTYSQFKLLEAASTLQAATPQPQVQRVVNVNVRVESSSDERDIRELERKLAKVLREAARRYGVQV